MPMPLPAAHEPGHFQTPEWVGAECRLGQENRWGLPELESRGSLHFHGVSEGHWEPSDSFTGYFLKTTYSGILTTPFLQAMSSITPTGSKRHLGEQCNEWTQTADHCSVPSTLSLIGATPVADLTRLFIPSYKHATDWGKQENGLEKPS